jgi:hypothetical protein
MALTASLPAISDATKRLRSALSYDWGSSTLKGLSIKGAGDHIVVRIPDGHRITPEKFGWRSYGGYPITVEVVAVPHVDVTA